jgi:hypothetical protein
LACKYPLPETTTFNDDACVAPCKDKKQDPCCVAFCFDDIVKFFVHGSINAENVTSALKAGIIKQNLSLAEWLPVIEKSIETCNQTGENLEDFLLQGLIHFLSVLKFQALTKRILSNVRANLTTSKQLCHAS